MRERTPEMVTAASLRSLKRQGVREVEWAQTVDDGGVVLRARVQVGRAHVTLETRPHDDQQAALDELGDLVRDAARAAGGQRRRRSTVTARRVQRPGAGEPAGEVDDTPLETVAAVMERRDREAAERAARRAQIARAAGPAVDVAAAAARAAARPAARAAAERAERRGRRGGR